jgi:hypothetical protein
MDAKKKVQLLKKSEEELQAELEEATKRVESEREIKKEFESMLRGANLQGSEGEGIIIWGTLRDPIDIRIK